APRLGASGTKPLRRRLAARAHFPQTGRAARWDQDELSMHHVPLAFSKESNPVAAVAAARRPGRRWIGGPATLRGRLVLGSAALLLMFGTAIWIGFTTVEQLATA